MFFVSCGKMRRCESSWACPARGRVEPTVELSPAWEVEESGMEQRPLPRCPNVASMVCVCVVCVCVQVFHMCGSLPLWTHRT